MNVDLREKGVGRADAKPGGNLSDTFTANRSGIRCGGRRRLESVNVGDVDPPGRLMQ